MVEEFTSQDVKAPFNMALNTLERLGSTLSKISATESDPLLPLGIRQAMKVILVRQFFIQATPLLTEEVVTKHQSKVLELKPNSRQIIKVLSGGQHQITNDTKDVFDWELNKKLDEILLEIQRELQKEKYFMP